MPFEASSMVLSELIPNAKVKLYNNHGHGLYQTAAHDVLRDVLEVVESSK